MSAITAMRDRPLSRGSALAAFAVGGGALYLLLLLGATLGLGEDLPLIGWIGFAVVACIVLAVAGGLAVFLVRSARAAGAEPVVHPVSHDGPKRVLVLAEEGCPDAAVCEALVSRAGERRLEVFVSAPALVSPVHYLDSDVDEGRAAARRRLDALLDALGAAGIAGRGAVGSESPLEAIADALAVFPAEEIVVVTSPERPENWLDRDLLERARRVHGLPVSALTAAP